MGLDPSLREQEQIAEAHKRYAETLSPAERRAEWIVGGSFVLACGVLLAVFPPEREAWYPLSAACCVLVLVVALRAQFDTGTGFTVPVQIAFVPLLFTLPPALAPAVVVLALVVGKRFGLDADRLRNLEFAALLHDVGKVAIPWRSSTSRGSSTWTSGRSLRPTRSRASACSTRSAAS